MSLSSSPPSFPVGLPSLHSVQTLPPPLPETLRRDDYAAADQARQRFNKRRLLSSVSLPHLSHLYRSRSKSRKHKHSPSPSGIGELERSAPGVPDVSDLVALSEDPNVPSELDEDYDKDVYRWAILYENQRGATVFSTAYYSPLSLLPLDPPPFTIPTPNGSPRRNQPTVSLEDYPLPDGSWKWVSRIWMLDMRGDSQVQYDGFEYSSSFHSRKWGPDPGFMSHRGLVRRRRWIRLMMRPMQARHDAGSTLSVPEVLSVLPELDHHEEGATRPPSVMLTATDSSDGEVSVWRGDVGDWERCHLALRRLDSDGRKLELWASWLGAHEGTSPSWPPSSDPTRSPSETVALPAVTEGGHPESPTTPFTEVSINISQRDYGKLVLDTGASPAKPPKEYIAAVIRAHGLDISRLFVYPDSRAKFAFFLARTGLLPDLREGLGILDFWSYTQDMDVYKSLI